MVLGTLGAAYLKKGYLPEAQRTLETALLINPEASTVHFHLGLVLQEMGRQKEALRHFQRAEQLAPLFPEIDYHLGVLLGQMNELGLAHFHLGQYYQQKRDWKLAAFHYKKAKPLLQNSPEKLETIDEELEEMKKKKKRSR
jgi:tetratricopeptide (TPR) repeat protein